MLKKFSRAGSTQFLQKYLFSDFTEFKKLGLSRLNPIFERKKVERFWQIQKYSG